MNEIRVAILSLTRRPATPAIVVFTLALCIGATTAVFSLVNSVLLRPLPVPHPEALVAIEGPGGDATPWTFAIWQAIQQRPELFDSAMAWSTETANVATTGEADAVNAIWASASFFKVLGIAPERGRLFTDEDDRRGGGPDGPVMVISHAYWMRRFGGDSTTVGQVVTFGTQRVTVIGVTPPAFDGPDVGRTFDVIRPLGAAPVDRLDGRQTWWLTLMARLAPGQTIARGQAALAAAEPGIRLQTRPDGLSGKDLEEFDKEVTFRLRSASTGNSALRDKYSYALLVLLAAVGAVLLVACTNVANLMLVRADSRAHEMTVRVALGAARWQLLRSAIVEAGLLAAAGAGLGLGLAQLGSRALVSQVAATPVTLDLTPDIRVLGFTLALAAGTALLFGIAPAIRATAADPTDALKAAGRSIAKGGRVTTLDVLVAAQIALSLVLVVAGGLLVRTFATLATEPLGFDADRLVSVDLLLPRSVPAEQRGALYEDARARAAAVPGVSSAALSLITPISGAVRRSVFQTKDGPQLPDSTRAFVNLVSPEWFETTGMRILTGRGFTDADRSGAPNVAIVNDAFVHTYFGGANPIGQVVIQAPGDHQVSMTVVGVVPNSYYRSLRETLQPIVYEPIAQATSVPAVVLTARTARGSSVAMVKPVSAAVGEDRRFRLVTTTYAAQVAGSLRQERLVASLSGSLGLIALVLAAVGLYGVTRHTVQSRRRELGIRLMLGSDPPAIAWLTLRRVAGLVGAGLAAGTILSFLSSHFIAGLLFAVQPHDFPTLAGAAVLLTMSGGLAAWRPLRQAARIDPVEVLRTE